MGIAERAAERSVRDARERAQSEVQALVDAGIEVLARRGEAKLTVAEVLAEAHLSTRAFYRHFRSRDELVLAVYEHESERTGNRLGQRVAAAPDPPSAVRTWIDETLSLATRAGRRRRTAPLAAEGPRLQARFPDEFATIVERQLAPLRQAIAAGRDDGTFPDTDPDADALAVHAITWGAVQRILAGSSSAADEEGHVSRFCLAALEGTG